MEALALSASVFSVASLFIQLAEKVQQLHDFWNSFQNAPSDIKHVVLDLQMFCDILDEGARSNVDSNPLLFKVLTRCDSKVESLKRIVESLEPGFASKRSIKRKWSSFKATLKKKNLTEFQRSLADTKLDLILIHQALAEKSSRHRFVTLNNSITDIASQSSSISTKLSSIDSRTTDANQHITDVHSELQQMVEYIQERTYLNASTFPGAELEHVFRKAIQDTMQSHDGIDIIEETGQGARQGKKASSIRTRSPLRLPPNLGPSKYHGADCVEHADNNEDLRQHVKAKRDELSSSRKQEIAQCTYAEYKTIFGTISWRSRAVKITHKDRFLGHIENDELETYIAIRPAPWLLARCLNVQISRTLGGWTWRGRQFQLVPDDSLIFRYCKDGNLTGVRDLFQYKLASPFDIDNRGYTPLHYAARCRNSSMCKLLIQAGAVVDAPNNSLKSPLVVAAAHNIMPENYPSEDEVIETFRALVTYGQADTSWLDSPGPTFWRWAGWPPKWNQGKGLYWLIEQEETYFDPGQLYDGETSIMSLLAFGGWRDHTTPMLDLLIDKGVDVDAQKPGPDQDLDAGYTALHFVMRYLCSNSVFGYNPLSNPFYGAVAHLLRRGANPHLPDSHGHTPTVMALAAGTLAFGYWKYMVRAHRDIQDFVRLELKHCSSLRDAGWDEIALLDIFHCNFTQDRYHLLRHPCYYIPVKEWDLARIDRNHEPWWFDLQELIKAKKTPLPPVPRGWKKIKVDDGSFQYVEISTGLTTRERPKANFFANLQTRKARRMYREDMIRIETEGCETELDDWCSDEDEGSSEDSEDDDHDSGDESEGTCNDESNGNPYDSDPDEQDSRKTERKEDSTCRALSNSKVEELRDSDEEEEFHDAQTTPLTYPDGP